jgi:geranylgeranyl pyrophosphate synthase
MSSEESRTKALEEAFSAAISNLPGMDEVAAKIESTFESEHNTLNEVANYLFSLGGKRLRPIFTLLIARAFSLDPKDARLTQIAAGIELIHLATLLHDDIIDNSPLRRNAPSPLANFGMPATLLSGDFLLVRAFALCAHLDEEIIRGTERACVHLVEGEIAEGMLHEYVPTIDEYINSIAAKKTAALFALGAFSAGHLAGVRAPEKQLLLEAGRDLGISFQILDDILDVTSKDDVLGKVAGTDIRERKPSIVNILWLQSDSQLAKRLLTQPTEKESELLFIKQSLSELNNFLPDKSPLEKCRLLAREYAEGAKTKIHTVANSSSLANRNKLTELDLLIDYTLTRIS